MKDKLRLLLNDLLYRRTHCIGTNVWYHKEEVDKTITEILSLVKECVGEDYNKDTKLYPYRTEFEDYEEGWNDRGKQFLANIEGEER